MTLQASGVISMSQVAVELGRASNAATSLNEPQVRGLAQVASGLIRMNNLYGKTGRFDGNVFVNSSGFGALPRLPFFGATLDTLQWSLSEIDITLLNFVPPPVYAGNIRLINNTTGASCVLTPAGGFWKNTSPPANIVQLGATSNYTITSI